MIEPPRDIRRTGILEVDDGVLVAIELLFIEQGSRTMDEASEFEVDVAADALAIEAREKRRRGSPIKAFVVIKDPNSQCIPQSFQNSCGEASVVGRLTSRGKS
jgi:hypothetical protein